MLSLIPRPGARPTAIFRMHRCSSRDSSNRWTALRLQNQRVLPAGLNVIADVDRDLPHIAGSVDVEQFPG